MRPETGAMRFGDDWTGIFLRGDDALARLRPVIYRAARALRRARDPQEVLDLYALESLHALLGLCAHSDDGAPPAQVLRPYDECEVADTAMDAGPATGGAGGESDE
jgi:hypothetical protein